MSLYYSHTNISNPDTVDTIKTTLLFVSFSFQVDKFSIHSVGWHAHGQFDNIKNKTDVKNLGIWLRM